MHDAPQGIFMLDNNNNTTTYKAP